MKFSLFELLVLFSIRITEGSSNKRLLLQDSESIAAAIHQLQTQLKELNATHAKDVAELKAAHAQEVAELKAGLTAETLERCRTGSIYYHDAEIGTKQQCSQGKVAVFSPPFTKVPIVTFSFSELDISGSNNLRVMANASAITTASALLCVTTWADTAVYSATVNWMACPNV